LGKVGQVLRELGDKEWTDDLLRIISNSLFTMRWTCLSLMAIRKTVEDKIQQRSKFGLYGISDFQTGFGNPDTMALMAAQRIDDYLRDACACCGTSSNSIRAIRTE
jgi:hypothetical protein